MISEERVKKVAPARRSFELLVMRDCDGCVVCCGVSGEGGWSSGLDEDEGADVDWEVDSEDGAADLENGLNEERYAMLQLECGLWPAEVSRRWLGYLSIAE